MKFTKEKIAGVISFGGMTVLLLRLFYTVFFEMNHFYYSDILFFLIGFAVGFSTLLYIIWTPFGKKELTTYDSITMEVEILKKQIERNRLKEHLASANNNKAIANVFEEGSRENPIKLKSDNTVAGVGEIWETLDRKYGLRGVEWNLDEREKFGDGLEMMQIKVARDGSIHKVFFQKSEQALNNPLSLEQLLEANKKRYGML